MVSRTFILGVMRGVDKMGGSRLDTSSCPIDLKFIPVITINLRNSDTEWADLNQQSAFLQTGLVHSLLNIEFMHLLAVNSLGVSSLLSLTIKSGVAAEAREHLKYDLKN